MNPGKIFIKGTVHTHGVAVMKQGTIHHTSERNRVLKKIFVLKIMFTCASKTIAAWYYGAGLCESYMNKKRKKIPRLFALKTVFTGGSKTLAAFYHSAVQ